MNIETLEIDPSQQSQIYYETQEIKESEHRLVEIEGITYLIQDNLAYVVDHIDQVGNETFTGQCGSISDKHIYLQRFGIILKTEFFIPVRRQKVIK